MRRGDWRWRQVAGCVVLVSLTLSCASPSHIREKDRSQLRTISIAPSSQRPTFEIRGIPDDPATNAAYGAAEGALLGSFLAFGIATAACIGSMGTACVPAYGSAIGGGAVGGLVGAAAAKESATDTEVYEQQQEAARSRPVRLDPQSALALSLSEAAGRTNLVELSQNQHADVALVAGFERLEVDELGYLRMTGAIEFASSAKDSELPDHDFEFLIVDAKKPSEWVADEGVAIDSAIERALDPIAVRLIEELATLGPFDAHPALDSHLVEQKNEDQVWRLSWQLERHEADGAQVHASDSADIQLRIYAPDSGPACLDWLRRENYDDAPDCLTRTREDAIHADRILSLGTRSLDIPVSGCGLLSWAARLVASTQDGPRHSAWYAGPPMGRQCVPAGSKPEPAPAHVEAEGKLQYRVLWGNRVDCYLYRPHQDRDRTLIRVATKRELPPGPQVIGGVCAREHVDVFSILGTASTENAVSFWLRGNLEPGRHYSIEVTEVERNLSFSCVRLISEATEEELDRFCVTTD